MLELCKKGILCLSGGFDSAALLVDCEYANLCVFFNYGSKQNKVERLYSKRLAEKYKKEWLEIDVRGVFEPFRSALLQHSNEEIELGSYEDKKISNALVPFRNGIFASILVGLAESRGYNVVLLGVHKGDHRLYPDCTPSFINSFAEAVRTYSENKIFVEAPFVNLHKKQIAFRAWCSGLDPELTYSCYLGGEKPCGKCPTCIEREEALKAGYKEGVDLPNV